jgi:hypothetical protein
MVPNRTSVFVRARRAASIVRDLFDVVREVNEWRHERDAFVAMYMVETRRRADHESRSAPPRLPDRMSRLRDTAPAERSSL